VGLGGAGRDDADDFFIVVFIKGMDNQKARSRSYRSDGYPTLFIAGVVVSLRNGVGIVENENGSLKANVCLRRFWRFLFSSHVNRMATRDNTA